MTTTPPSNSPGPYHRPPFALSLAAPLLLLLVLLSSTTATNDRRTMHPSRLAAAAVAGRAAFVIRPAARSTAYRIGVQQQQRRWQQMNAAAGEEGLMGFSSSGSGSGASGPIPSDDFFRYVLRMYV